MCDLQRALYGLRQAPRQWHAFPKQALERCGFAAADADPGLFVRDNKGSTIFLLVYVNESFAKSPEDVIWAANTIQSAFDARDLGAAHVYLGRTIAHDRHLRILMLSLSG